MKFYKENKINPAASCLPLLAQLPIFLALFFVLRDFRGPAAGVARRGLTSSQHRGQGEHALVGLPAARDLCRAVLLDVLHVRDDGQDPADDHDDRPAALHHLVAHFPVGLVIYWVTTNLWTVGQGLDDPPARAEDACAELVQARVPRHRRRRRRPQTAAAAATAKPKPAPKPASTQPRRVKRKKWRSAAVTDRS